MSKRPALIAFMILSIGCASAFADVFVSDNTSSGWYGQDGYNIAGNLNYYTGNNSSDGNTVNVQLNDYFTFDLSGVSGTIVSATFNVYSWFVEGSGTYSIYSTSLTPSEVGGGCSGCVTTYDDLTSGSLIGSISVAPGDTDSVLTIDFDAAGLSWLTANEGTGIVLGGSEPEPSGSNEAVFSSSTFVATNNLTIATAASAVPEPVSILLLGSAVLAVTAATRKKLRELDR